MRLCISVLVAHGARHLAAVVSTFCRAPVSPTADGPTERRTGATRNGAGEARQGEGNVPPAGGTRDEGSGVAADGGAIHVCPNRTAPTSTRSVGRCIHGILLHAFIDSNNLPRLPDSRLPTADGLSDCRLPAMPTARWSGAPNIFFTPKSWAAWNFWQMSNRSFYAQCLLYLFSPVRRGWRLNFVEIWHIGSENSITYSKNENICRMAMVFLKSFSQFFADFKIFFSWPA